MNERSIFLEALEISDAAQRAVHLDRACGGDPALRRLVEELLAAAERSGDFLTGPACGETLSACAPAERPGAQIGPYKLLQQIGEGGMGVVFMAQQEEPVRRTVALKIIRQGMDSKSVLARFEAERQALAMMDHPNIARVLDAGTTESGAPFFVMELVKGVPITRFCEEHHLSLRERLGLFIPVCQAIQHAHQKGIIHRDIKPSNVLIALYDDHPVPKVIDFGVAKATGPKLTDKTLFTAFGSVVGTLEYMSPEQARLNQLDIDTRSDVYALGVLLYELLTGSTPLDRARLASAAFDEVLRIIREEEPARPSTRLSSARTQPDLSPNVRLERERMGEVLRGELDWIVMKALEKDRARRYETANGLARDIQRYLEDEPVEACPPTIGYRLSKAYRRNRAAVAAAGGFGLLLAASALLATGLAVQARKAERRAEVSLAKARENEAEAIEQRQAADKERCRAEEERRSSDAVRDFLQTDLLGQASEFNQAETRRLEGQEYEVELNPTIRELLDRAAIRLAPDRIDERFPGLPFVQAEVLKTVGNSYFMLAVDEKGIDHLRRAVDLYTTSRGLDDPAALDARRKLADALWAVGRADEAEPMIQEVIADMERVLGPHHPETYGAKVLLGSIYLSTNQPERAVALYGPLAASAREHLGPSHLYALWPAVNLAEGLSKLGRFDEAISEMERVFSVGELLAEGRPAQFDHPGVQAAVRVFAEIYKRAGRPAEASRLYREALAAVEERNGPLHQAAWQFRHLLAWECVDAGAPEAAIPLFEANLPIEARSGRGMMTREALAQVLTTVGRLDEAVALRREALGNELARLGAEHRGWRTGKLRVGIGQIHLRRKEYAEAEPFLSEGYRELLDHREQSPGYDWRLTSDVRRQLVELYEATGRPEQARGVRDDWVRDLKAEFERTRQDSKSGLYARLQAARELGLELAALDRDEEVIPVFEEAFQRIKEAGWPVKEDLLKVYDGLRLAVARAGRHDLAAKLAAGVVDRLRSRAGTSPEALTREVFALAHHLLWGNHPDQAEPLVREALAGFAKQEPDGWLRAKATYFLGTALSWQKKNDEAERVLMEAHRMAVDRIALAPSWEKNYPAQIAKRLAELYVSLGRADEAEKWGTEQSGLKGGK